MPRTPDRLLTLDETVTLLSESVPGATAADVKRLIEEGEIFAGRVQGGPDQDLISEDSVAGYIFRNRDRAVGARLQPRRLDAHERSIASRMNRADAARELAISRAMRDPDPKATFSAHLQDVGLQLPEDRPEEEQPVDDRAQRASEAAVLRCTREGRPEMFGAYYDQTLRELAPAAS